MDKTLEYAIETVIELGVATGDEMRLVLNINGHSMETVEAVIYAKTGLRNIEQLEEDNIW